MKVIGRNWKAVLSVLLLLVAVLVYVLGYRPRSEAYVMERDQLNAQITALQTTIVENEKYKEPAVRSWATPRNCTIFSFSASGAAATSSFLSVRSRRCRP